MTLFASYRMDVNCHCPCFTWTKLEPAQSAPPPSSAPRAQPEQLREEMVLRYHQSAPCPDLPRPPPARTASPAPYTAVLPSVTSPPLPVRLRQQKSLVREDNYGFEMAQFYGEVQRRDTLNSSTTLSKSTPGLQSPNLSFQH